MTTYGEIGTFAAGVVAGVTLTADTEVTVSTITMPRTGHITEINYNYGNVTDAKASTGYLELKSNLQQGPWRFPVGFGAGGAATLGTKSNAGKIPFSLNVQQNEIITITMTMNEACVSAHAGIIWTDNTGGPKLYADCNTAEDAAITAATREQACSITIPQGKGGRIKQIRVAVANVVNAKDCAGYIEVICQNHAGPFNFVVGGGGGGATDSGSNMDPCIIDCDIPIDANEIVTIWYYFTDAQVNANTGIVWVA